MDNLHHIQMKIIRSLTFTPGMRFSELNLDNLPSDQFSYHLRTLISQDLIVRKSQKYSLSSKGKLYSSHIDTDKSKIEKLPKTSVLVIPTRVKKSHTQYLIHTRQKEPYFGYSGFVTGKIRFGETVEAAAQRELAEETGVEGISFRHHFIIHEMVYNQEGKQLEDKFFNVVSFSEVTGTLELETEDGCNQWVTEKEFRKMSPLFHNELDILDWYLADETGFKEESYFIDEY